MKTQAVRMYAKEDLRLEEFELPEIAEDEILAKIITNSICMSSWKAAMQGADHKRVPSDIAQHPVILGHEFCGEILQVGSKWSGSFSPGQRFSIQPALNYQGSLDALGYSFGSIGGNATYIVIPDVVMEQECLLPYNGEAFFFGSLAEPVSCIVGTYQAMFHTRSGSYEHIMGISPGGCMAILAGVGPMGLETIDYALHGDIRPRLLVVTDIDPQRLERAQQLYPAEKAHKEGVELVFLNTGEYEDPTGKLIELTGGHGYDDVMVMAPVKPVVEQADAILARDGCLNFFAGPGKSDFSALINFYNIHYASHHIVGTSGGNTEDMRKALEMMESGRLNPAAMVTHIGGLDAAAQTILDLPNIPGGKKLIYTQIEMPLTAIEDFERLGRDNPLFARLAEITAQNDGLWSAEAERHLLAHMS